MSLTVMLPPWPAGASPPVVDSAVVTVRTPVFASTLVEADFSVPPPFTYTVTASSFMELLNTRAIVGSGAIEKQAT